jgi:hypothetical protein
MKKILQLAYRVLKLPGLFHEALHCLPAWAWGLEPRIDKDWGFMLHRPTTTGKHLVIILTPACFGVLVFPLVWFLFMHKTMFYLPILLFWLGWMLACQKDLGKAGYYIFFKQWPKRKDENHE